MLKKIYWASDSTVQTNHIETYPQTGMGQVLPLYLKDDVIVLNHAVNGRSTKKFLAEGRLAPIKSQLQKGDFFFIEFGHNDWHTDPERHTEAFGDYQENLKNFIEAARMNDAHPVLITPVYCRFFLDDGTLNPNVHFDYPAAMKELAEREGVALIDLCEKSKHLLANTDPSISKHWYMNLEPNTYPAYPEGKEDNAHMQYNGAVQMAGLIANGLLELGGEYAALIRPFHK